MEEKLYISNASGLAGLWHEPEASRELYFMLHAIQHRGSDGAGMAAANGQAISAHKSLGMLSEVFTPAVLDELPGNIAVGHIRMKTPQDMQQENLQPIMVRAHQGSFALVFSGMLLNASSLRHEMEQEGLIFQGKTSAEVLAHLIQKGSGQLFEKIQSACQKIHGAYAFLLMTKNTMYAVRSSDGIRALYIAKTKTGYAFASESCALNTIQARDIKEVGPGQMIILGKNGYESRRLDISEPAPAPGRHVCSMEAVYYSRGDSLCNGKNVHQARSEAGKKLARKETIDADIVVGVPDTALSAAAAFARELGKPYEIGLIKNRYIGSTFIQPTKTQRDQGLRVRLNAISSIVKDKKIYLIDDSIQKGSTAKRLCQLLREAGASEVHLRIASPPIRHSCLYGTEHIDQSELAAASYTKVEMQELFGADSLRFLEEEDFASTLNPGICTACFDGQYPISDSNERKNPNE